MAISTDTIASAFSIPEDDVGIEFLLDFGGRPATLDEMVDDFLYFQGCQTIVSGIAVFAEWIQVPDRFSEQTQAYANALTEMASAANEPGALLAIRRLAEVARQGVTDQSDFRLDFAGSYLENPTTVRFIARGSLQAVMISILLFGGLQLMKEHGAEACRAQHADIAGRQSDMLKALAQKQGRWTPELRSSHQTIINALTIGTQACGSWLGDIKVHIKTAIGDFEVRAKAAASEPEAGDGSSFQPK